MAIGEFKSIRFHELGGPEVLKIEAATLGSPGPNEVLIKVLAIGVTQGDVMYRKGTYLEQPELPSGLGTEACGIIVERGVGAEHLQIGQRVSVHSSHSINRYPVYGEYAVLPISSIVITPEGMSDVDGAAFTLAYLPMYLALMKEASLKAGETVLLNAAGATTSIAACQIANKVGAKVVGLVRSERTAELVADVGYSDVLVVSETTPNDVNAITNGKGVDVVLDPVGGSSAALMTQVAGERARIIHYGALESADITFSLYQLIPKFLRVSGFTIYGYTGSQLMDIPRDEEAVREAMSFIQGGVSKAELSPKIAAEFDLDQVVEAHEMIEAGGHVGKIVLRVAEGA